MIHKLTDTPSIANTYLAELRDKKTQTDPMRFRLNMKRLGQIFALEISKHLDYKNISIPTPLGTANTKVSKDRIVLATIMRAGLALHDGLLSIFDRADNAFVSAYRRHKQDGSYRIAMDYITCPDLAKSILILCDPMLATGASMNIVLANLLAYGKPKQIHIVTAIASTKGIKTVSKAFPDAHIWIGDEDSKLDENSLIIPGLGDAGDLAYGDKLQR